MKKSEMLDLMTRTWKDYVRTMGPNEAGVRKAMIAVLDAQLEQGIYPPIPYFETGAESIKDLHWEEE